jgi:hypothetical protein
MLLSADIAELPAQLWHIFYTIVLPVLLLAATGWALQRRGGLDMVTLKRLNFHFVIPVLIYVSLVISPVGWRDAGQIILFSVAMIAALSALAWVVGKLRKVPADVGRVMMMTTMSYNSGNFALPLQDMAFRGAGLGGQAALYQTFVMLTQNLSNFTWGILVISAGNRSKTLRENLAHIVRFPPIWAMAAGIATILARNHIGPGAANRISAAVGPFWEALIYVKSAFIAVALVTLGAQLALVKRESRGYPVGVSVVLRLLVGPAIGLAMVYAFGLSGFLAQVMLISTTSPTAVNCMLLAMEFDNHPDYAARAVFYSTLLSPITVTLVIWAAQGNVLPGFNM